MKLLITMALFVVSSVALGSPDNQLVMTCQERNKQTNEPINVVAVLEQVGDDGGKVIDNQKFSSAADGVEGVVRFYLGDLRTTSIEQITAENNPLDEVSGTILRLGTKAISFRAIDNGYRSHLAVDYDKLDKGIYSRTDGKRTLFLKCNPPMSVAEAFPNRPDVKATMQEELVEEELVENSSI